MAKFVDNSPYFLSYLSSGLGEAGQEIADIARDAVQEKILYGYHEPHGADGHTEIVDTGRLFDSIESKITGRTSSTVTVSVSANTEYASYVHQGTYKLNGRPFVTDGVNEAKPEIRSAFERIMRGG